MKNRLLIIGNCITEGCLRRRNNHQYLSVAGRKKLLALSKIINRNGTAVDIYSSSFSKHIHPIFIESIEKGIRIIHAPTIGFFGKLSFFKRAISTIVCLFWITFNFRSYRSIIFYNYHIEYSFPAVIARLLFNIKIIMDYEDGLFLDKGYQGILYLIWEKIVYRFTSHYLLVNEGLRARIRSLKHKEEKSLVVHGLIDRDKFSDHYRSKTGPIRNVLFSGNFSRNFGFEELIQYVKFMGREISFDITGKASQSEEQELIALIGEKSAIRYHGFLPDDEFKLLIEGVDAFIVLNDVSSAYNQTNFPSKFFDYLSYNKFILTTMNPLFEKYYGLQNVICISDFEKDLKNLEIISTDRLTNYREIEILDLNTQKNIQEFLDEVPQ